MKDYEGTWVLTKRKYYIFKWDFGKYKKTIDHSLVEADRGGGSGRVDDRGRQREGGNL